MGELGRFWEGEKLDERRCDLRTEFPGMKSTEGGEDIDDVAFGRLLALRFVGT